MLTLKLKKEADIVHSVLKNAGQSAANLCKIRYRCKDHAQKIYPPVFRCSPILWPDGRNESLPTSTVSSVDHGSGAAQSRVELHQSYDIRLVIGFKVWVCGSSGAGKSVWIINLIKHLSTVCWPAHQSSLCLQVRAAAYLRSSPWSGYTVCAGWSWN